MERKTYLNRYQLSLGPDGLPIEQRSGHGAVFSRAEDTAANGQEVALQIAPIAALRPAVVEQLQAEAASAKRITHLNIPRVLDFGIEDDHLIYVTEYLDGTTAEEWVTAHGPMPLGAALRIALQVVNALGAATFHGILHHALNPRNLLLVPGQTPEGEWPLVKVLNFIGVAPTAAPGTSTAATDQMGKFSSPEQLLSGAVDFRSEIYSLGATLWFLLTGAAPAKGAASLRRSHVLPKQVTQLITQMLATDPSARPHDPLAFQEQIRDCLAQTDRREAIGRRFGLPVAQAVAAASTEPPRERRSMQPLAWAAAFLALAGLAALFLPASMRPDRLLFGHSAIGVPVGVPEPSATPVVTQRTQRVAAVAPVANAPIASSSTQPQTTASPALNQNQQIASDVKAEAPVIAQNTKTPPQLIAADSEQPADVDNEPAPPAEGPAPAVVDDADRARDLAQAARSIAEQEPVPSPVATASPSIIAEATEPREVIPQREVPEEREASVVARKPASQTQPVANVTPQPPKRIANREVRTALPPDRFATSLPPLSGRSKRARYVGTAPDGSLVFEMPSEERVFVAPPAYGGSPRRRIRQRPVEDLPVLPAEPVPADEIPSSR